MDQSLWQSIWAPLRPDQRHHAVHHGGGGPHQGGGGNYEHGDLVDSRADFCPQQATVAAKTLAKAAWVLRAFMGRALPLMRIL